jgi:hypothetical protein
MDCYDMGTGRKDTEHHDLYFMNIAYGIKEGYYRFIGKGSGRAVYDMGSGKVVKAARNMRGIAQNITEYRIALNDDSGMFAKATDISGDYRFLVMEKAEPVSDISSVWDHFHVESNQELYQLRILRELSERYSLLIHDFGRAVNWGMISGRPVIVDYGFTRQVRRRFYASKQAGMMR